MGFHSSVARMEALRRRKFLDLSRGLPVQIGTWSLGQELYLIQSQQKKREAIRSGRSRSKVFASRERLLFFLRVVSWSRQVPSSLRGLGCGGLLGAAFDAALGSLSVPVGGPPARRSLLTSGSPPVRHGGLGCPRPLIWQTPSPGVFRRGLCLNDTLSAPIQG